MDEFLKENKSVPGFAGLSAPGMRSCGSLALTGALRACCGMQLVSQNYVLWVTGGLFSSSGHCYYSCTKYSMSG